MATAEEVAANRLAHIYLCASSYSKRFVLVQKIINENNFAKVNPVTCVLHLFILKSTPNNKQSKVTVTIYKNITNKLV